MKNRSSLFFIFALFISISFIRLNYPNYGQNGNYGVLSYDNFGYFLYLPATFIYDDPYIKDKEWVEDLFAKYKPSEKFYQAHQLENGNRVIQYSMGMAILYSPAFFVAHAYSSISDKYPADGYSMPYQFAVLLESLIIVLIGLILLRKFCLKFFNDLETSFLLVLLCLGTNYYQIVISNTSSPHALLFTSYALCLLLTYSWYQNQDIKTIVLLAIILGIQVLSRPNEILFLLIPIFWNLNIKAGLRKRWSLLIKQKKQIFVFSIILVLIGSAQFIYWKGVSGHWVYDSYLNEGFKFLSPYLSEYLFSYKKGWLLYTPMMIFSLIGFISLYRNNKKLFTALFIFTILNVWVLSSWDCWWYAGSFSQRSIVQSYPVLLLPLGYFIRDVLRAKSYIKTPVIILLIGIMGFNLFQTYQQRKGIIHISKMNKEYYWAVWGQTELDLEKYKLLEPDRNVTYIPKNQEFDKKLLMNNSYVGSSENNAQTDGYLRMLKGKTRSSVFSKKISEISKEGLMYLKAKIKYHIVKTDGKATIGLIFSTIDSKSNKSYKYANLNNVLKEDTASYWQNLEVVYATPYLRNKEDVVEAFIWLNGDAEVQVDQYVLEAYDYRINEPLANYFIFGDTAITTGNWSTGVKDKRSK